MRTSLEVISGCSSLPEAGDPFSMKLLKNNYAVIRPTQYNRHGSVSVSGTTGEGMLLKVEERKSLLEAWVSVARPAQMKVIAQVGGGPLPDVLELAKHAEKLNVDGIMTLPELYYKPRTVDQLISYLQTVSAAAPTLPLIADLFTKNTVDPMFLQVFHISRYDR
ncbi:hypothetical protein SFRURICE_005841 [Spodoptera frugiperda]|nr:hypothetical protein SFRURICE_005841 [Spodoptera frugiperda]